MAGPNNSDSAKDIAREKSKQYGREVVVTKYRIKDQRPPAGYEDQSPGDYEVTDESDSATANADATVSAAEQENPALAAEFVVNDPLDRRLTDIEAAINGLGSASAGKLNPSDKSKVKDDAVKRAGEAYDMFVKLKDPGIPMQVGDIVKSIADGIDKGSVKPSPEILNWLMAMAPKYLEAPTPRSMAMQAAATMLMSGIARVGQSMSGKMLGPDAAAATAITGAKYIKSELMADKQLAFDVAVKNADIFNKYRDDVVRLAIEVDKQNTEREKARLEMFRDGIKNQVEIYKEEGRRYVAEKKELGRLATDFLSTAQTAESGELNRQSSENITKYKTEAEVSMANLRARTDALGFRINTEKMRQDNLVNLSDEQSDRMAAAVQVMEEYGVDRSLFGVNTKIPRGEYERNIPVASILGGNLADAIAGFSRSRSVTDFNSDTKEEGELANLITQIGRAGKRGIFIDPTKIRNISAADMEFFADITTGNIILDAKTYKSIKSGIFDNPDTALRTVAAISNGLMGLRQKLDSTTEPIERNIIAQKIASTEARLEKVGAFARVRTQSEAVNLSNQMMMVMLDKLAKPGTGVLLSTGLFGGTKLSTKVEDKMKAEPAKGTR